MLCLCVNVNVTRFDAESNCSPLTEITPDSTAAPPSHFGFRLDSIPSPHRLYLLSDRLLLVCCEAGGTQSVSSPRVNRPLCGNARNQMLRNQPTSSLDCFLFVENCAQPLDFHRPLFSSTRLLLTPDGPTPAILEACGGVTAAKKWLE